MNDLEDVFGAQRLDVRDLLTLDNAPTVDDFQHVIRKLISSYGLENAIYYCPTLPGRALGDPFLVLTYQPDWVQHYIKMKYETIDPVVNTGARSLLPVDWSRLERNNAKVIRMFNESRAAGVGSQGMTIPVRGGENGVWGLFSVTSNESDREWGSRRREIVSDLVLIANFLHQKAYGIYAPGEHIDLNAITLREKEALAWTSEGKSVADIATLMRISAETVKAHLDSARFKLGALNRVHAVSKAIRNGIIR